MSSPEINKFIERLPYADGSGRRRFISGSILLFSLSFFYWDDIKVLVAGVKLMDLLKSPVVVAGVILIVYAIGNVIELFSEYFLIRAVSGVFYSYSVFNEGLKTWSKWKTIFRAILIPYESIGNFLLGMMGKTKYTLNLKLSAKANLVFAGFPQKVKDGLVKPIGDNAELAIKYAIDQFEKESDRTWARRLINRTKDVSMLTSSLFIVIIIFIGAQQAAIVNYINPVKESFKQLRLATDSFKATEDSWGISNGDGKLEILLYRYNSGEPVDHNWFTSFESALKDRVDYNRERDSTKYETIKSKGIQVSKALSELQKNYFDRDASFGRSTLALLIAILAIGPFVFLYVGFFKSLRVAVITILELISLEVKPDLPAGHAELQQSGAAAEQSFDD